MILSPSMNVIFFTRYKFVSLRTLCVSVWRNESRKHCVANHDSLISPQTKFDKNPIHVISECSLYETWKVG